jgi:two-component sensor histidine kinase
VTGEPSICNNLAEDNDFKLPPFYAAHNVVSIIDIVIKGDERAYGVLEIASDVQRDFDRHDIEFLTGFANVLAEAVATSAVTSVLQTTIDRMKHLVEEKDRLLEQKNVLAEELQHRVRNNLQVVCTMLSKLLSDTADQAGQRRIKSVERRVCSLARVYDHLHGGEMTRTLDFAFYVKSLCLTLAELQGGPSSAIMLSCDSDEIILDLDTVTTLGLVTTELVSNAYEHAFPDGKGSVSVSVRNGGGNAGSATMTIRDSGAGFTPKIESKRHGLGLVRRLMEQIHGTVSLDSAQGSVWTIQFPTTSGIAKAA